MMLSLYLVLLAGCARGQEARVDPGNNEIDSQTEFELVNYSSGIREAVSKAAAYLLNKRQSDFGWSSSTSTSRAIVALTFTNKIQPLDGNEKALMKKQLDIQFSLDLMTNIREASLSHHALYINALYATCQDPNSFQGMDLVSILRSRTNSAMEVDFNLPAVVLTLCIAGKYNDGDMRQLEKMYWDWGKDRRGSMALALMAMVCNLRRGAPLKYDYVKDFFLRIQWLKANNTDVYTKALIIQAFNAVQHKPEIRQIFNHSLRVQELLDSQLEDGSFGDLLSTYYAIPALLDTSLLHLKCKHVNPHEGMLGDSFSKLDSQAKKVIYSLRMHSDTEESAHSTVITFSGNKTFYDIMKMAAARDPMFRFMSDDTSGGRMVYSLAGIPNDAETGMAWTLYRTDLDGATAIRKHKITTGVNRFFPKENNEYVFMLKRS